MLTPNEIRMQPIRVYVFRHLPDMGEARLSMTRLADGRLMVVRSMSAGFADIGPAFWRYQNEPTAWGRWVQCQTDLEKRGFQIVQTSG